jgi:hypothetical protein
MRIFFIGKVDLMNLSYERALNMVNKRRVVFHRYSRPNFEQALKEQECNKNLAECLE